MYTLTTTLELPIAHCLYNGAYSGLCVGNVYRDKVEDSCDQRYDLKDSIFPIVHGHGYMVTINLGVDDSDLDENGMVVDFKLFKKIIKKHLEKYDHSLILTVNNPLVRAYKENFEIHNISLARSRLFLWGPNENPTAELMAYRWWAELLGEFRRNNFKIKKLEISVEETLHNKCTYSQTEMAMLDCLICGIYKVSNLKTGKFYIGRSFDILSRWQKHLSEYEVACGDFGKDLRDNFNPFDWDFSILEECKPSELNKKEAFWIDFYKAREFGYNKTAGGDSVEYEEGISIEDIAQKYRDNNKEAIQKWKNFHPGARKESDKRYENTKCVDPITGEIVTLTALRARMKKHIEIYNGYKSAVNYKLEE